VSNTTPSPDPSAPIEDVRERSLALTLSLALAVCGCAAVSPNQPESLEAPGRANLGRHSHPSHAWLADLAALQILEQLGESASSAGRLLDAAEYFSRAADCTPSIPSPTGAWLRIWAARALVQAKQLERGVRELERAVQEGFRFDTYLTRTEDFSALSGHADFEAIVRAATDSGRRYAEVHRDPARAKLEFSDVDRFWVAYDLAKAAKGMTNKAAIFREHYLASGTPGLIDYYHIKIASMEALVAQIEKAPAYFEGIRTRTLAAKALEPQIRTGLERLVELYPEATVPDVTFAIGRLNSGGTAGPSGMLVGLDIWSWSEGVSLDGITPGMRTLLQSSNLEQLPLVVLHEHVHTLQVFAREKTLLDLALAEGSADFIAGLALPEAEKPYYYRWGMEHESEVWRKFQQEMSETDTSKWIANQSSVDEGWSADLGYFVGARIAEAYYAKSEDKAKAIRDLLFVEDSTKLLAASGYAPLGAR
jgi:hypothetical protein